MLVLRHSGFHGGHNGAVSFYVHVLLEMLSYDHIWSHCETLC